MSDLSWNLRLSVRAGQTDAARSLMREMVAATREELGTLCYEWFLDAAGATCHIQERYVDAAAAMIHCASFDAHFAQRFLRCFEPTGLAVYGEVSAELRAVLDGFGAVYFKNWGGFRR